MTEIGSFYWGMLHIQEIQARIATGSWAVSHATVSLVWSGKGDYAPRVAVAADSSQP